MSASTPYTSFVRDNYPKMKESNPEANSKDILRLIAAEWNKTKPPKEDKKPKPKGKKAQPIEITGDNVKDQINNILVDDDTPSASPVSVKRDSKTRKVIEKANGKIKKGKGGEV